MSSTFQERIAAVKDVDEVFENPEYYGLPTFDDFVKNQDKYLGREDEALEQVDRGSKNLEKHVQRHIYEIEGYRCKSLEEVERVAKAQGISLSELDYRPQVMPVGAGKCDLLVKFVSKSERDKRNAWK